MRNISIEGQESVQRGHCVVETNFGTIHAGIENLHEQIEKILHLAPPQEEVEPPAPESS